MSDAPRLTVKEAAAYLSVSEKTIRRMLVDGRLTPIRVGRTVRIDRDEVKKYNEADRKLAA
jgi:excisionase family DNA binding protein